MRGVTISRSRSALDAVPWDSVEEPPENENEYGHPDQPPDDQACDDDQLAGELTRAEDQRVDEPHGSAASGAEHAIRVEDRMRVGRSQHAASRLRASLSRSATTARPGTDRHACAHQWTLATLTGNRRAREARRRDGSSQASPSLAASCADPIGHGIVRPSISTNAVSIPPPARRPNWPTF